MKRLSFQWRMTLITALLIAVACIAMNLLLYHSGTYYIDSLDDYVVEYGNAADEADGILFYDMTQDEFDQFYSDFSGAVTNSKAGFWRNGWFITAVVTLLSGAIAYFLSGRFLRPLRRFSEQAEQIQIKTLTEIRLSEDTIPEFQRLSHSINQMLDRLSHAFEAQGQFVGNAAHELRTPLALMRTRLDLYRAEHPLDASEASETLVALSEQTDRLSHLVRTLLDMSELESIPRTEHIRLFPMVEEVLTDLAPLAEARGITLEQEGDDVILTGSDALIYRLLFNLVENGIKYNRPGGRVTVCTGHEDDNALIIVSDTGPGIPAEHQDSVFQPFFRVDKSRSRAMGGVGLGLSLVWEIARLHGGEVRVKESSKDGTRIMAMLPCKTR